MTASARTFGPGDTAFVTGGAQGIGLGLARALAQRGVRVALADVDTEKLAAAEAELAPRTRVVTVLLDVRDRVGFVEAADRVEAQLGPVSLLFNNAGIATGQHVTQMDYAGWDRVMGINLDGVGNGIQTFVPRMLARQQGGYVVNTASGAGIVEADTGFLYTASKFAVVGLSEALHRELAPFGIGVSALCPGRVATDIVRNSWGLDEPGSEHMDPAMRSALEAGSQALQEGASVEVVADLVLDAMSRDELYVFTDDELRGLLVARHERILAALDRLPSKA